MNCLDFPVESIMFADKIANNFTSYSLSKTKTFCLYALIGAFWWTSWSVVQAQETSRDFPMVTIPTELHDPATRASYLGQHYWDRFNFRQALELYAPEVMEQALCNFIDLMRLVPAVEAEEAFRQLIRKTCVHKPTLLYFLEQCEAYLYDADSPVRREEWLIPVLQTALTLPQLDAYEKVRPEALLALLLRNRVGEAATDFAFVTAEGLQQTLYELPARPTLLYFMDPACDHCQAVTRQLVSSEVIGRELAAGRLQLLALYPGEEEALWRSHLSDLPVSWIRAWDASQHVVGEELYDIARYPTLYLLDASKRIWLKNATWKAIESALALQE